MRAILTVSLPKEMVREVNQISRKFHLNKSELVKSAIRKYLWNLRFKSLRAKGIEKARRAGFFTDEDVFARIS